METGGLNPQDTEDRGDLRPNGGCKLSSTVRDEQDRNSKPEDPGRDKSLSTGFSGDGGQRNSLRPSGGSVDHSLVDNYILGLQATIPPDPDAREKNVYQ